MSVKQKSEQDTHYAAELAEINRKLSEVLSIHEIVATLMEVKTTVDDIERSIQAMSDKYDEVLDKMRHQDKDIVDLKKRVEQLESKNADDEIQKLRRELNELDQYSRRQNLEVHGLPQTAGENLLSTLNAFADKLELPHLDETNVEAVHRLPSKPNKIPPVIVRFSSRVTKETWLAKKDHLRRVKSETYLLENLTAQNKRLLWLIKSKAAEKDYQFAWQKNGKMFVRKRPQDRVIKINGEEDLIKIQ